MPQEPVKLTKSAIKKAQRLARIEAKQRQKQLKAEARSKEDVTTNTDSVPVDLKSSRLSVDDTSTMSPVRSITQSEPLPSIEAVMPETVKRNGSTPSEELPAVQKEVTEVEKVPPKPSVPIPGPESNGNPIPQASPSANGSTLKTTAKDAAINTEQVKKRQNVLTRVIWTFIMIGGFIGEASSIFLAVFLTW